MGGRVTERSLNCVLPEYASGRADSSVLSKGSGRGCYCHVCVGCSVDATCVWEQATPAALPWEPRTLLAHKPAGRPSCYEQSLSARCICLSLRMVATEQLLGNPQLQRSLTIPRRVSLCAQLPLRPVRGMPSQLPLDLTGTRIPVFECKVKAELIYAAAAVRTLVPLLA